uniref:PC-esterase domain-containing protein 1A n=1 Tax=Cacopsylla melanoneura TaxID=428564 RepID=A0A8D8RBV7_9HEMI
MADIFSKREMENMLKGKHILILGDSNMRALYKDLVWLINQGSLVNAEAIRAKGERSYLGDKLLGSHVMTRARHYVEHREYDHPSSQTRLEFKFITQVLSDETRDMLELFRKNRNRAPSVILINSTLWDLSRWGPNGDKKFRNNLRELFSRLRSNLPCDTVVIAHCTPACT